MIRFDRWLRHLLTDHEPAPHPFNPNMGDVDEIATSVMVNGCYAPVYVSARSNHMLKGHHLYLALRELGATQWPIAFRDDLTPEEELRMMLADNKTGKLARLDPRLEEEALQQLVGTELELAGTGYRDRELERLTAQIEIEDQVPLHFGGEHTLPRESYCPTCGQTMSGRF